MALPLWATRGKLHRHACPLVKALCAGDGDHGLTLGLVQNQAFLCPLEGEQHLPGLATIELTQLLHVSRFHGEGVAFAVQVTGFEIAAGVELRDSLGFVFGLPWVSLLTVC